MCRAAVFFFQAEDGIRDGHVTGVQTCALPISGLLHTASDLEEMSVRVESGASPWAQGYERLAANGHAGADWQARPLQNVVRGGDRKSTRLNSSHVASSYAVFCWKTKTPRARRRPRPRP